MDEETKKQLAEATSAVLETRKLSEANKIGLGEMEARIDNIGDDLAEATKAAQLADATAKRVDEIETRMETLKEIQHEAKIKPSEHREAIREFLRTAGGAKGPMPRYEKFAASEEYRGFQNIMFAMETRTITEGTFAEGGLFLDPELDSEIIKNYVAIDPIRSVADVRTISTLELDGYRRIGTPTMYHGTELANGTYSNANWIQYKIPVYPGYVDSRVSSDMLNDVRFVESEITSDAGEAFGYGEGVDFLSGTGVDRANGVLYGVGTDNAKYPATVTSSTNDVIGGDDFAYLYTALAVVYRPNSTWAFNSDSLKRILILKEATTNAFIWQPGLQAGPPAQIYGRPYIICESMANQGNGTYPIMLGDFRRGYRIVDRSGIELLRDVYTSYPAVNFRMRKRFGGMVIKPEAIKILVIQ